MNDRPHLYILDAQDRPVAVGEDEESIYQWAIWYEDINRIVKQEKAGDFFISTVFLGVDYGLNGPPVLWESIVFRDGQELECDRCSGNREQAEALHEVMVNRAKALVALEGELDSNC
jgi:hypothetical protein